MWEQGGEESEIKVVEECGSKVGDECGSKVEEECGSKVEEECGSMVTEECERKEGGVIWPPVNTKLTYLLSVGSRLIYRK